MDYYSPFWSPKAISMVVEPQHVLTCWSSRLAVWADSGQFLALLLSFGVQKRFPRLAKIGERLRAGHQQSQFWLILARFVDYYKLFWGPRVISMTNKPRGAFTCRSSTLVVFVDSGPFHGLLLTFSRTESDFHGCRTPRCAYVSVINTRTFWPILA